MLGELNGGFESAPFHAGWIKLSAGDDGITELEATILRAAARAAAETNAIIGSHTIKGRVVMDQLDIIEAAGGNPARFISIHTQAEPDFALHRAVAARGAWIEYDHVGREDDNVVADMIIRALDAGLGGQLLVSHDRGWYDPAKPGGGTPDPYTHLSEALLPLLRQRGVDEAMIVQLTHDNPFNAYAR
jgi:phosphotriesterase-related protein